MDFKKLIQDRRSIKHFDAKHTMNKDEINELFKMTYYHLQHLIFSTGALK